MIKFSSFNLSETLPPEDVWACISQQMRVVGQDDCLPLREALQASLKPD